MGIHLVLFAVIALVICIAGALYGEYSDAKAWTSLPKRLFVFCGGSAILAVIMLLFERMVG